MRNYCIEDISNEYNFVNEDENDKVVIYEELDDIDDIIEEFEDLNVKDNALVYDDENLPIL